MMIENCKVDDCQKRLLVAAIVSILEANDDFRKGMPANWDGDLLQDACDSARFLLISMKALSSTDNNRSEQ